MVYRVIRTKGSSNSPNMTQQVKIRLRTDQYQLRILVFHADLSYNCMLLQVHNILPIPSISVSTKRLIFVPHRKRTSMFKSRHSSNPLQV